MQGLGLLKWQAPRLNGRVAQLVEQQTLNLKVEGSTPSAPTTNLLFFVPPFRGASQSGAFARPVDFFKKFFKNLLTDWKKYAIIISENEKEVRPNERKSL